MAANAEETARGIAEYVMEVGLSLVVVMDNVTAST